MHHFELYYFLLNQLDWLNSLAYSTMKNWQEVKCKLRYGKFDRCHYFWRGPKIKLTISPLFERCDLLLLFALALGTVSCERTEACFSHQYAKPSKTSDGALITGICSWNKLFLYPKFGFQIIWNTSLCFYNWLRNNLGPWPTLCWKFQTLSSAKT